MMMTLLGLFSNNGHSHAALRAKSSSAPLPRATAWLSSLLLVFALLTGASAAEAAQTLSSMSPNAGFSGTNYSFTITGSGFVTSDTYKITWGDGNTSTGTFATSSTTLVASHTYTGAPTQLFFATVTDVTQSITASNSVGFQTVTTPTVTAISPAGGAAGTHVVITGSGFNTTTAVNFGSTAATGYFTSGDTQLTATAPSGTGTVDITVTTAGGTTATSAADQFTYYKAPTTSAGGPYTTLPTGSVTDVFTITNNNSSTSLTGLGLTTDNLAGDGLTSGGSPTTDCPGGTASLSGGAVVLSGATLAGGASCTVSVPLTFSGAASGNSYIFCAHASATGPASLSSTPSCSAISVAKATVTTPTYPTTTQDGQTASSLVMALSAAPTSDLVVTPSGTGLNFSSIQFTSGQNSQTFTVTCAANAGPGPITVTYALSGTDAANYTAPASGTFTCLGKVVTPSYGSLLRGASSGSLLMQTTVAVPSGLTVTPSGSGLTFTPNPTSFGAGISSQTFTVTAATNAPTGPVAITYTLGGSDAANYVAPTSDSITVNAQVPAISSLSATQGYSGGGNTIVITGTGFTGATAISFGTASATSFTVLSDTTITVSTPAHSAAPVDIQVTGPGGASSITPNDKFTYVAVPSASPNGPYTMSSSGTLNFSIVVTNPNSTVALSGISVSSTLPAGITGSAPSTGTCPGGSASYSGGVFTASGMSLNPSASCTISVTLTPTGGAGIYTLGVTSSATSPSVISTDTNYTFTSLTVYNTPAITSISPTAGPAAGGTSVTITGTDLTGATAVKFGATSAASMTVNSSTQITATAPAGAGTVDITVTTPGGTSATVSADHFTYVAAPAVTSISPTAGPTAGGTTVIITGTNFSGATAVNFGASSASSLTVNSPTQITAVAPAGAGTVDITVTTGGGTSATSAADQFTYVSAPAVTAISPISGATTGGTSVVITGTNFSGATAVTFGATSAISLTVNSATQITATAPAGSGTVDVRVTTAGGTSATSGNDQFTYVSAPAITSISPTAGPTAGGTVVTLTGTNFSGATAVTFGATAATSLTVNSATSITATAPAGTGTVDIRVTATGGTSATSAADQFTFVAAPTVTAASPASGPTTGGTSVVLTGTNFSGTTSVKFGATPAAFTVNSPTQITATAPAGTGTVDITVTTVGGTSTTATADQFTYVGAPTVTAISPASGSTAGGTSVVITGTNFTGATAVTFGATSATSLTVNSATQITAVAPSGSGTVDIRVTTPGGTSTTATADQFTYVTAPTVTALSVTTGPASGGTSVSLTGTGYSISFGGNTVTVGGVPATVNAASATHLLITTPAHAAGTVDVVVTVSGQSSTTSAADQFTYIAAPAVTAISPSTGPATGGTSVTITGANFTGATAVKFGSTSATSLTVNSATQITAVAPAGAGTVDITVTAPGGTSATATADQFTYVSAPAVTAITATSGSTSGGTTVTITGSNFSGVTAVKFGAVAATSFVVNSATQITATAPAGTGIVDVTVTAAGGTTPTSGADQFTYVAPPVAGAVSTTVNYNSSNDAITLNLSGGTATGVAIGTGPSHGTVAVSGLAITYTPAANYSGTDSFTYTASNAGGTSTAATVTITVSAPPLTATQAVATTVLTQGTAVTPFTPVTASGGNGTLSYALSGGTLPAGLTFATATGQISGTPTAVLTATTFTVTVTDQTTPTAQTASKTFSLTVNAAPAITTSPANVTVTAGATATFTAAASGTPAPTVQWQMSTDGGATFANIAGATSLSYGFVTSSAAQTGTRFRAVFTNAAGSVTTSAAVLTVTAAITVSTNPVDATVFEGETATFTVAATGTPAPTVQWQKKAAGATAFADIAGATATTLSFAATLDDNGSQYHAVFTNSTGTMTTTAAKLTVQARPDPTKDAEVMGVINTETQTTVQFADQQITIFDERLERLHGDGYAGSGDEMHLGFGFGDNQTDAQLRQRADLESRGELYAMNDDSHNGFGSYRPHGPNIEGMDLGGGNLSGSPSPDAMPAPLKTDDGSNGKSPVGVWLGGALTFGHRDPNTSRASFKFQSAGTSLGVDLRVNDKLSLGIGMGVNDDTTRIGTIGTKVKSSAAVGVVYGTVRPGGSAFVDFILAGGALDFDSHRAITGVSGQFADGERSGTEGFASVKAGWDWSDGKRNTLSPYGRVTMVNGQLDAFTESTGGMYALSYQKQSVQSLTLAFGGKASRAYKTSYGVWIPNVTLEYAHEFNDDGTARLSYADWAGGPVYAAPTDPYFHDRIVTGFGANLNAGGLNFSIDYRHNFDSGSASSDTVATQLKLTF